MRPRRQRFSARLAMRSKMSKDVSYRLAREDDLFAMRLIQSKALYDLVVTRSGRPPSAVTITDEPSSEMRHLLGTDREVGMARDGEWPSDRIQRRFRP